MSPRIFTNLALMKFSNIEEIEAACVALARWKKENLLCIPSVLDFVSRVAWVAEAEIE